MKKCIIVKIFFGDLNYFLKIFKVRGCTCRRSRRGRGTSPWRPRRSRCWGHRPGAGATCTSAHTNSPAHTAASARRWTRKYFHVVSLRKIFLCPLSQIFLLLSLVFPVNIFSCRLLTCIFPGGQLARTLCCWEWREPAQYHYHYYHHHYH